MMLNFHPEGNHELFVLCWRPNDGENVYFVLKCRKKKKTSLKILTNEIFFALTQRSEKKNFFNFQSSGYVVLK